MKMAKRLFLTLLAFSTLNTTFAKEFVAAIEEFSYEIRPESFQYHPMVYILRQLHETLFSVTPGGLRSRLLKSWDASRDYKKYKLCLNPNIHFSNNQPLTVSALNNNLKYFSEKNWLLRKIISTTVTGDCLDIEFADKYPGFIDDCLSLKLAIIDPQTRDTKIPVGISVYKVDSSDSHELVLSLRKEGLKPAPYFDRIRIVAIGNEMQDIKTLRKYHEINLLRPSQLPPKEKIIDHFTQLEIFESQNVYLLANHQNRSINHLITNCTQREKLAKALSLDVKKIPDTFFAPESGTKVQFKQSCRGPKLDQKIKVTLLYFFENSKIPLVEKTLNEDLNPFNVFIEVKALPKKNVLSILESKDKNYDAVLLRLDGVNYPGIINLLALNDWDKRFLNIGLKGRRTLQESISNGTRKEKFVAMEKFLVQLKKSQRVMPLASLKVHAYYPTNLQIQNDNNTFSFFEYRIEDLKEK